MKPPLVLEGELVAVPYYEADDYAVCVQNGDSVENLFHVLRNHLQLQGSRLWDGWNRESYGKVKITIEWEDDATRTA